MNKLPEGSEKLKLAKDKQEERALDLASAHINERYYKGDKRYVTEYFSEVKCKLHKDNDLSELHIITGSELLKIIKTFYNGL